MSRRSSFSEQLFVQIVAPSLPIFDGGDEEKKSPYKRIYTFQSVFLHFYEKMCFSRVPVSDVFLELRHFIRKIVQVIRKTVEGPKKNRAFSGYFPLLAYRLAGIEVSSRFYAPFRPFYRIFPQIRWRKIYLKFVFFLGIEGEALCEAG